ncbi:MAG: Cys-tRNA(Pro) deacylase [Clostridiales bacterium]|nr:Cys-tRNA(Pro) deacylase [Clostridiales bacterium]
MSNNKIQKTNAMRILDSAKTEYKTYAYECAEAIDGVSVAEKIKQDPDKVFKTLVTCGRSGEHYVFVIPVARELDLKKAAGAVGEKFVEMIHVKDINKITGYVRGGCSPIGMKKPFRTVIDSSAENFESIIFSGGRLGLQIETSPASLSELIGADFVELTV